MVWLTRTEDFNSFQNGVINPLGVFRGAIQLRQRERDSIAQVLYRPAQSEQLVVAA
jgi:hypothetical protein